MDENAEDLDRRLVEAVLASRPSKRPRIRVEIVDGRTREPGRRRPRYASWYKVARIGDRRADPPDRGFILKSGDDREVVGTDIHTAEIAGIVASTRRSRYVVVTWAALVPMPGASDRVAVQLDGVVVGELEQGEAAHILPALRRVWEAGVVPICRADTYGGGTWKGFEIWLYYAPLDVQMAYLDKALQLADLIVAKRQKRPREA